LAKIDGIIDPSKIEIPSDVKVKPKIKHKPTPTGIFVKRIERNGYTVEVRKITGEFVEYKSNPRQMILLIPGGKTKRKMTMRGVYPHTCKDFSLSELKPGTTVKIIFELGEMGHLIANRINLIK